jgi:IS5 family transposase
VTPANVFDGAVAGQLLTDETDPVLVLGDAGYSGGATRATLREAGHRLAIKPKPLPNDRPGFGRDDFIVDEEAGTVTCPAGNVARISPKRRVRFGRYCVTCPSRTDCTSANVGRLINLSPDDAELVEARRQWREGTFTDEYRTYRPMVERGIAWLVANNNRRLRYRGVERNDQWLKTRIAALNLRRLVRLGLTYDGGFVIAGT